MSKLPCEVVKDLFPSYIDELTGEVTNQLIEEHTKECENCRQTLASMKEPEPESTEQPQKKEIDYLKKTRKKNRKNIMIAVIVVLALVLGGFGVKHFFVGTTMQYEYLECQVKVDGKSLTVDCLAADANLCITDIDFEEEGRVINIVCKGVGKNPLLDGVSKGSYVAENNIKEVRMGDRILWAEGEHISAMTSAVYQTRHPYVGDMPANDKTAKALHMDMVLKEYENQLQTDEEPYKWVFKMEEVRHDLNWMEATWFRPYAYILLAVVENLGEVSYEFQYGGEPMVINVTEEMASDYAGLDIKYVGKNIAQLQKLIEKTGLHMVRFEEAEERRDEGIKFEILNLAEDDVHKIGVQSLLSEDFELGISECYLDIALDYYGETIPIEVWKDTLNENNMAIFKETREVIDYNEEIQQFYVRIWVNTDYEAEELIPVPMKFGETYQLELTGSAEKGYHIRMK